MTRRLRFQFQLKARLFGIDDTVFAFLNAT